MIRPGILGVLYKGVLSTYTVQVYRRVLGTFHEAFSKGRLPKWRLPKCANSQAATSQWLG